MSAIRVLILGVLSRDAMHGYDVRRTLEQWHAEQWANIAYGSIYSALETMERDGLVSVAPTRDAEHTPPTRKKPARITYTITEQGRAEFLRLLRDYWWGEKPWIDPFQVALTFMDRLPRDEVIAALRARAARSQEMLEVWRSVWSAMSASDRPRFLYQNRRLDILHVEAELRWIEDVLPLLERGELP